MPCPFAEPQMCRASHLRLVRRYRFDPDTCRFDKIIQPSLGFSRGDFFQPAQDD